MAGPPGFSVSELITAVDWTIKFIIDIKQARDQVEDLLKDLTTSRSQLKGLEQLLENCHEDVNHRAAEILSLQEALHLILNDSICLVKRFHPGAASRSGFLSDLRGRFRWVIDNRYPGTVKDLQERISKIKGCIAVELQFLTNFNLNYLINAQKVQIPSVAPVLVANYSKNTSSTLDKDTGANSSPAVSQYSSVQPGEVQPISGPLSNQFQPQHYNIPIHCPPSPPPSPPSTLTRRSTYAEAGPNRQNTDVLAHFGPPSRSQTASTAISDQHPPQSLRRASTFTAAPSGFTLETLPTTGTVKVWFKSGNPAKLQPHIMKSIGILRDGAGSFRGVEMTPRVGKNLQHKIDPYWENVTKHPLPDHSSHTTEVHDSNGFARFCVRFYQDKKGDKIPRYYSFSNRQDYCLFQSKIIGKSLLFWAEVNNIWSAWSGTNPTCEAEVLQVWEDQVGRSIHFFRNGKDRTFSQHDVSSLRVEALSSNGSRFGLSRRSEESNSKKLKLVFVMLPGKPPLGSVQEQEKIMNHLIIEFTNLDDKRLFLEKAQFPGS